MPKPLPPSESSSFLKEGVTSDPADSLELDQPALVWRQRLKKYAKPRIIISAFLLTSALYCFVIGRDRYTSVSEFVIQQAAPLQGGSTSVLAGAAAAPQVMTSLVDGQYLQVYLESSDIKNRLFPDTKNLERLPTKTSRYLDWLVFQ